MQKQVNSTNLRRRLKRPAISIVLLVICAVLIGLSYNVITSSRERKPQRTQNDRLAIIELVRREGTETVFLPNDYGFLIQWLDNMEPNLYIYNKPESSIKMTSDFTAFLAGLEEFPDGAKVDRIRGCGTTAQGMSENKKIFT